MSGNLEMLRHRRGRDATHRASKFDTHLTHGCIQLFRHFPRVRLECALEAGFQNPAIPGSFASALRTRMGGAS